VAGRIQKKVVLLGTPGVGKTSLVRRYVQSLFTEKYHTTIGVKVDKKLLTVGGEEVLLMIWDVAGPEKQFAVPTSYIQGAAGYLLVVDGTRPETLVDALDLVGQVEEANGRLPFALVINKADRVADWRVHDADLVAFQDRGCSTFRTSAKTGEHVDDAFRTLAESVLRS
jgi:small GTP-binding protein